MYEPRDAISDNFSEFAEIAILNQKALDEKLWQSVNVRLINKREVSFEEYPENIIGHNVDYQCFKSTAQHSMEPNFPSRYSKLLYIKYVLLLTGFYIICPMWRQNW